jgi:hypothetical protein
MSSVGLETLNLIAVAIDDLAILDAPWRGVVLEKCGGEHHPPS